MLSEIVIYFGMEYLVEIMSAESDYQRTLKFIESLIACLAI